MKIELEIPQYSPKEGLHLIYEPDSVIKADYDAKNQLIEIAANRSGLLSLAKHLIQLADEKVPKGEHFHLDEFDFLEKGSKEVVFLKIAEETGTKNPP
jgi:hypothetical protein